MISRRLLIVAAAALLLVTPIGVHAADSTGPVATVQAFYDTLLQAMKGGPQLGFSGRRDLLAPAVRRAFDLPTMTRITIGPQWTGLSADEQQKLIHAFSDYSIATYANRFDDYSGEKFDVGPKATPSANGDVIVHSKLMQSDGQPVELDYLMRQTGGDWKIVDVYLSGTISQLAAQRSEFTSVMRKGGAAALIQSLRNKAAQLAS
ncbi:MAG: ABC transporter substrate-binding protein [Alphaproteobacteria bacterium]|nr:ABC transporter substrate-binding protein [Alphaproteobacteria bacterium]